MVRRAEGHLSAREEGLIRWIGVTGHGAQIAATHRRSLDRFDFDSVLLPCNYVTMQSSYYRENFEALLKTCQERNVAVQTIKSIALRPWMERDHTRTTWYQPLEEPDDIDQAVWWVLGRQGIFLNSVTSLSLGVWYHVAATVQGATVKLYINGLLDSSGTTPVAATTTDNPESTAYLNFLRSGTAKPIFEQYGFTFLVRPTS